MPVERVTSWIAPPCASFFKAAWTASGHLSSSTSSSSITRTFSKRVPSSAIESWYDFSLCLTTASKIITPYLIVLADELDLLAERLGLERLADRLRALVEGDLLVVEGQVHLAERAVLEDADRVGPLADGGVGPVDRLVLLVLLSGDGFDLHPGGLGLERLFDGGRAIGELHLQVVVGGDPSRGTSPGSTTTRSRPMTAAWRSFPARRLEVEGQRLDDRRGFNPSVDHPGRRGQGLTARSTVDTITFRFSTSGSVTRARPPGVIRPGVSARNGLAGTGVGFVALAVKDLIDAGVHFGHRASRWNPKMKPYIYGKRNLIHIIDLKETVRGLLRASKYFNRVASAERPDPVRRHQAAGGRDDRRGMQPGGHALRHRALAGRHADQLPDDPQPARTARGAGDDPRRRAGPELRQEDDLDAHPRAEEDRAQPLRHPQHDPAARGPADHRPAPRAHRGQGGQEARDQGRRPARHRLRPRRDRPADPGQRRQHAVDRAGREAADRLDHRRQGHRAGRAPAPRARRAGRRPTAAAATAGATVGAAAAAARAAPAEAARPEPGRRDQPRRRPGRPPPRRRPDAPAAGPRPSRAAGRRGPEPRPPPSRPTRPPRPRPTPRPRPSPSDAPARPPDGSTHKPGATEIQHGPRRAATSRARRRPSRPTSDESDESNRKPAEPRRSDDGRDHGPGCQRVPQGDRPGPDGVQGPLEGSRRRPQEGDDPGPGEGQGQRRQARRPGRQGGPGRGLHPPRRQVGGAGRGQLRDRLRRPQRRVPPARQGPGPPRRRRQPGRRPPRGGLARAGRGAAADLPEAGRGQARADPRQDRRGQAQLLVRRERPARPGRSSRTRPRRSAR